MKALKYVDSVLTNEKSVGGTHFIISVIKLNLWLTVPKGATPVN